MKRKINEKFTDGDGNQLIVRKAKFDYPVKCVECFYYSEERGCQGAVDETGDCRKTCKSEDELYFQLLS